MLRTLTIGGRIALGAPLLAGAALLGSLCTVQIAEAKSAPSVDTGGARVTDSSATLKGSIDPHGNQTTYYFQYGLTTAYGVQTPTASAGNGRTRVAVSQEIIGLQPDTTYHYRLVAVTSTGKTLEGQDRTFTTKSGGSRRSPLSLKLVKPLEVTYGSPVTIEGILNGAGTGGRAVVVQSSPFPFLTPFANIGSPTTVNAGGLFSFSVAGLTQSTRLRVTTLGTRPIASRPVLVEVAVRVTLKARPTAQKGYVRLYGTVTPAVVGAAVVFQVRSRHSGETTVASTFVKRGTARIGRFSSLVFLSHSHGGSCRALVQLKGHGKLVSGYSSPVLVHGAPAAKRHKR